MRSDLDSYSVAGNNLRGMVQVGREAVSGRPAGCLDGRLVGRVVGSEGSWQPAGMAGWQSAWRMAGALGGVPTSCEMQSCYFFDTFLLGRINYSRSHISCDSVGAAVSELVHQSPLG